MPRYAPLPAVEIDPRNEAQLVNEAAKRVYDASNAKLNDFSAGNPMMALIEGQAFAQGEFLFWANQLPESILLEWIGPFLGAMRRLGTPSTTRITVSIAPQQFQVLLPEGTQFNTDSNLTNGESIVFVTTQDLVFSPGQTVGQAPASSVLVGTFTNVAPDTITGTSSLDIQVTGVTNAIAAVGGSDVEPLDQTKERFFTLIRRRNPVSSQDWQDLFEDLFGAGTFTSVLPNRSAKESYIWLNDYVRADGHISFFFLNPDGTEPTVEQVQRAQNVVDFSLPLEMQGHVYPIDLSQVQFELDLSYKPTADYAGTLRNFSLDVRDSLFSILTPGNTFPSGYDPTVADIDSALLETFPAATKYSEPDILDARAYNTPPGVNSTSVINTQVLEYSSQQNVFSVNDLLVIGDPNSSVSEQAWPVVKPYSPYSSTRPAQVLYENLTLQKIRQWQPGSYTLGQVFRNPSVENSILVVLRNFSYSDPTFPPDQFILDGILSAPKDFQPWEVGNQYYVNNESTGFYDPDVVAMDQEITNGEVCDKLYYEPGGEDNLYYRVGWYCYVVNSDFILQPSTNTTIGAQSQGLVANSQVPLPYLKAGGTYAQGGWIRTPILGSGPDEVVDPYYYYVDISLGAIVRYAYVNNAFTFLPSAGKTLNESFSELVASGIITVVNVADANGVQPLFQYQPRFGPQTYLAYRETNTAPLQYYFSLTGFTPTSSNPNQLVADGFMDRVDTSPLIRAEFEAQILPSPETGKSIICPPLPLFVFSPGDTTLFREGGTIVSYIATQHFTPTFTPSVYIRAGILIPGIVNNVTSIPFYSTTEKFRLEDLVVSEDGKNIYRVTRFFTAFSPVFNWDGQEVPATARIEELSGRLLRVVSEYVCEENIQAPNGPDTSGVKLGVAQINLLAKNSRESTLFIWENTNFSTQVPELSYSTGSKEVFQPVSYGSGTLAL